MFVSRLSTDLSSLLSSTYLGGSGADMGMGIVVYSGDVYTVAYSFSRDFPTTSGAYDESSNGSADVVICKLSEDLSSLLASTYLGGSGNDWATDIDVSSVGVFIAGHTASSNFPVTAGAYDRTYNGGLRDAFVSHLDLDLSSLLSSSFLGGLSDDRAVAVELTSDRVYITGVTASPDFPANTFDTTWLKVRVGYVAEMDLDLSTLRSTFLDSAYVKSARDGEGGLIYHDGFLYITGRTDGLMYSGEHDTLYAFGIDVFVLKLDADNLDILGGIHFGGSRYENSTAIDATSDGIYIAGYTSSSDFPVTSGVYDETYNGRGDIFITKVNPDLTAILSSTYLGGSDREYVGDIAVAPDAIYVVGYTSSDDFPTTSGAYDRDYNSGSKDVIVSKLSMDLSSLLASTYLGGSDNDYGTAIALASDGVYLVGNTESGDFPTTAGAYDNTINGERDVFISKMSPNLDQLLAGTFLGGSDYEDAIGLLILSGDVYVAGDTRSDNFPITVGNLLNGRSDLFISRLDSPFWQVPL